jgi:phosphohistidine swiveling domain-containing protein
LTFCAVCDIDLQQAVNSALDNLRTKDFIRKEPSGGAGVVAGVSVVDTKTSGMVYINKDPATVTPEALMWHQNEILVISHPTSDARLKNFAGIITDHGGIACHAAIVARERNIPCIVGTGNATKVLSDGDFIVMNEPLPGVVNVRTMEEP